MDRSAGRGGASAWAQAEKLAVDFGREICGDLLAASSREWLVTNGTGSFASGTVSGVLSRRYHGLLIAALKPPLLRTLLVSKFDETATLRGRAYSLSCNAWASGTQSSDGCLHLERFHLDGTIPVWTYALGDTLLEKRVFMRRGRSATYVVYRLLRGDAALELSIKPLVNYRDYHGETRGDFSMRVERHGDTGLRITASATAQPYYLLASSATVRCGHDWYRGYALALEKARGFSGVEDHLCAGAFKATLRPGEALTLVASLAADESRDGLEELLRRQEEEQLLLARAQVENEPAAVRQLILAADQFLVVRPHTADVAGCTVIAGYPWFSDWGRDTMVSLAGLTLCTGRHELARSILRTFARFVDRGMLPNRFPDAGEAPEYNTVDATLLYFEALRAYHAATADDALLAELYPLLVQIIDWHERGTRHGIAVDPQDGLLRAGEKGVQLTWMDARVGDWVVTPRRGKPVEVNALFYNALCVLENFAKRLEKNAEAAQYAARAERVRGAFARFENAATGYLYDVLDGPDGDDATLRPNQIFAVSLFHSPLPKNTQRAVVDVCALSLLTSFGLRSLSPVAPDYRDQCTGDAKQRDGAYHQGTVWSWLLGPFVLAHHRVYGDSERALSYLRPLLSHLGAAGLGSISEIFDGAPPHEPRGCIAQAWSVAEWLRAYFTLTRRPPPRDGEK